MRPNWGLVKGFGGLSRGEARLCQGVCQEARVRARTPGLCVGDLRNWQGSDMRLAAEECHSNPGAACAATIALQRPIGNLIRAGRWLALRNPQPPPPAIGGPTSPLGQRRRPQALIDYPPVLATLGYAHNRRVQGNPAKTGQVVPFAHRAISNMKAWLIGTHHGVGRPHLQAHLDEFVFRHNRRGNPEAAFQPLLGLGSNHAPVRRATIRGAADPVRQEVWMAVTSWQARIESARSARRVRQEPALRGT